MARILRELWTCVILGTALVESSVQNMYEIIAVGRKWKEKAEKRLLRTTEEALEPGRESVK